MFRGALSGGQRRELRAKAQRLSSFFPVADVSTAAAEIESLLRGPHDECDVDSPVGAACMVDDGDLFSCKFVDVKTKSEAVGLAMELATMTGSAVAECTGNECLLYKPTASRT